MPEARQKLGALSLAALGVNTIVGAGIFRLPAELARDLGPASILAHALGALLLVPVALSYAEAGGMLKGDGGAYLYARATLGSRAAFVVGWSMWLATVLTMAVAATAVPGQLAELVPALARHDAEVAWGMAVVLGLGAANMFGVRAGSLTSNAFALLKIAPLVLLAGAGLLAVRGSTLTPFAPHGVGLGRVGPALLPVIFALSGFESCATPAGMAARPAKDVPRAVLGSILGAALLYMALQLVTVALVPRLGASDRPLADAARALAGDAAASATSIVGACSLLGLTAAMAFVASPLLAVLADDGHLPRWAARRTPNGALANAAAVSTAAAALLVLVLDFRKLVDFTSVIMIVQYLATCVAVIVLRRTRPDAARAVRLPFGRAIPLAGAAVLAWLLAQARLVELALSAAAMASGAVLAVAYACVSKKKRGAR
jgi:amino acid transporter